MKKFFIIIIALILLSPLFSSAASTICYDPLCTTGSIQSNTGLGAVYPQVIVARIINVAFSLMGVVALVLMIYAGFIWMIARGNEEEVKRAQEILKGAVIGLVILFASYSIGYFVFNNLVNITNAY